MFGNLIDIDISLSLSLFIQTKFQKKLTERKADSMTQSLGKLEVFIISTSACSLKICLYVFVVWCNNSLIFVEMVQHTIKTFFMFAERNPDKMEDNMGNYFSCIRDLKYMS